MDWIQTIIIIVSISTVTIAVVRISISGVNKRIDDVNKRIDDLREVVITIMNHLLPPSARNLQSPPDKGDLGG